MLSKNISANKIILIVLTLLVGHLSVSAASYEPDQIGDKNAAIKIVYPKPDQFVTAIDSTFVLGNVPAESKSLAYKLFVNGSYVQVHEDGGFIAFLPVGPGPVTFELEALLVEKKRYRHLNERSMPASIKPEDIRHRLSGLLCITTPEPIQQIELDSLVIGGEYNPPSGDLVLNAGDRLVVSIVATPECRAWFSIPGVVDSVPMVETAPRTQPYWGESVFGAGAVPDSLKHAGIYTGFCDIPYRVTAEHVSLMYHVVPPTRGEIYSRIWFATEDSPDLLLVKYLDNHPGWHDSLISSYVVTVNDTALPFTVRFVDSVQTVRHRPRKGYFSIFQPAGVEALVTGAEGNWYRLQLSKTQTAWAHKDAVEPLPRGILPPESYLSVVRFESSPNALTVRFPLSGKHPYRIIEEDSRTICIQLFGVTSDTDWIRYNSSDELVSLATWSQPEEGLYEVKLILSQDLWGYDGYYEGNTFYFRLNRPPSNLRSLKGKRIVVDPGHSADPGAIGPTGLTEAEANLMIALQLKKRLESKGALVIMTRDDASHVALYDRPAIANANNADLFVSIHNNALPDGVNPFVNNGSSTYYYHPHSIKLARAIQKEMVQSVRLGDYGLYHGNLAVNRPTQYPAVLVECAFMILPEQEAMLKTEKFQKKVAKAVCKGIENFLKGYSDGR